MRTRQMSVGDNRCLRWSNFTFNWLVVRAGGLRDLSVRHAYKLKGLILAQNERWRRGLGMQVERDSLN